MGKVSELVDVGDDGVDGGGEGEDQGLELLHIV